MKRSVPLIRSLDRVTYPMDNASGMNVLEKIYYHNEIGEGEEEEEEKEEEEEEEEEQKEREGWDFGIPSVHEGSDR